jgi:colanic acid/amylovoran biosynthesis glycosyltransferase
MGLASTIGEVPLRLAYLVSQYPTVNHTYILREIRTLRSMGFDVEIIAIRPADRPFEQLSAEEKEEAAHTWPVVPQGIAGFLTAHLATLASAPLSYIRGLLAAIKLGRLDLRASFFNVIYFAEAVVVGRRMRSRGLTHLHSHFTSTVALLIGKTFPITFSLTIHGSAEFENGVGFHLAEKVASAHFVCAISQYGRSQLMRFSRPEHWHKIEVAPLGVNPEIFTPRPHRPRPERFEIFTLGQLQPAKGYPILIDAVGRLMNYSNAKCSNTTIRLRIAGGGADHDPLRQQIKKLGLERNIELLGPCSQQRVQQLYRETDLFALASFAEGVPVVLMEAMAMEIPCLATWITGIPELIRHGEDGWLVPPSDAEALAEAIALLIDDPELRERLGRTGRQRVKERYHLATNIRRLAESLDDRGVYVDRPAIPSRQRGRSAYAGKS